MATGLHLAGISEKYKKMLSRNIWISLVAQTVKGLSTVWETWVQALGWEDPLDEGNGNPLQYYCPENPMDTGDW